MIVVGIRRTYISRTLSPLAVSAALFLMLAGPAMDEALQAAEAYAATKYLRWREDLAQTDSRQLPMGPYLFTWRALCADGSEAGDFVTVMVHGGTGELWMFVAGYATCHMPPAVTKQQAIDCALQELHARMGADVPCSIARSRCVRSVPWAGGGAVWFVDAETTHAHGMTVRRQVIIDGTTGKVLTLPVGRDTAPAAPSAGGLPEE